MGIVEKMQSIRQELANRLPEAEVKMEYGDYDRIICTAFFPNMYYIPESAFREVIEVADKYEVSFRVQHRQGDVFDRPEITIETYRYGG